MLRTAFLTRALCLAYTFACSRICLKAHGKWAHILGPSLFPCYQRLAALERSSALHCALLRSTAVWLIDSLAPKHIGKATNVCKLIGQLPLKGRWRNWAGNRCQSEGDLHLWHVLVNTQFHRKLWDSKERERRVIFKYRSILHVWNSGSRRRVAVWRAILHWSKGTLMPLFSF